MKFTVVGGSGYVGRHVMRHLASAGFEAEAPARGDDSIFSRPLGHVLYCVGLTADFRTRPFDTVEAHVTLLARLLEHADFKSLLYLSSTRLYGSTSNGGTEQMIQVDPCDPDALYNASKLVGEALCLRDERAVRVVRLSNVYGGEEPSPSFVEMILKEADDGKIVLQSSEDSAKDFVHVDDVVPILARIALTGRQRLYNVASGTNTTFGEIVSIIATATNSSVRVLPGAARTVASPIDVSLIVQEFGWTPRPASIGLKELVALRPPAEKESRR